MSFAKCVISVCLATITSQAHALCRTGTVVGCSINGQPGTKECVEPGLFTPCEPTTQPPPPVSGTVVGKYLVLSVVYAPPGTNGGSSTSSVSYETDSSTGTTTTNASSFKQDYSVSASVTFGLGCSTASSGETSCPVSIGGGSSFEYSKDATHSDALDIKKSSSSVLSTTGPSADGVDHDRDQIWLLLRPKFDFTIRGKQITWTLDPDQSGGAVQFLYVGHLKDPSKLAPGILRDLEAAKITPQDYPDILDADPLAQCLPPVLHPSRLRTARPPGLLTEPCRVPVPSAPRYTPAFTSIPYDPPFAQGDPVPTQTMTIDTSSVSTHTDSYESSKNIGITVESGVDFGPVFKASLKEGNNFTWTETNTTATASGSEQKMSLTMGGPAFGYTGPTNMAVYYDTLYKTFAFAPFELSTPSVHGVILGSDGKARAGQSVTAMADGVKYHTFTNANGEYRFPSTITGSVVLHTGNAVQRLPTAAQSQSVDFRF